MRLATAKHYLITKHGYDQAELDKLDRWAVIDLVKEKIDGDNDDLVVVDVPPQRKAAPSAQEFKRLQQLLGRL